MKIVGGESIGRNLTSPMRDGGVDAAMPFFFFFCSFFPRGLSFFFHLRRFFLLSPLGADGSRAVAPAYIRVHIYYCCENKYTQSRMMLFDDEK